MFIVNIFISALVISFVSWLAQRRPDLAGFIISLPISTLLALALAQWQASDDAKSILLAKSISLAIPASLVFFIPFYVADRFKFSFWTTYVAGVLCLVVAYYVHRFLFTWVLGN